MRFAHLADLHIGKKLGPFDLLEDQRYALEGVLDILGRERVDAVFLSGDIYDRAVPSASAVQLADDFITRLARLARVFAVSGNHDSPERLSFGRALMRESGLIIAGAYDGRMEKHTLCDQWGEIDIWLLPFIYPREIEHFFEGESFPSSDSAVRAVISKDPPAPGRRSVLVAHQYVTSGQLKPETCDSEVNPVGGLSEVDASAFSEYDYVALGHLHAPQHVGRACVYYAGSLLKYSFSEVRHTKCAVLGDMDASGLVTLERVSIPARRDLRALSGTISELCELSERYRDDYVGISLRGDIPLTPMEALSAVYPYIVHLELPVGGECVNLGAIGADDKPPEELFEDFYRLVTGEEMTDEMRAIAGEAMARAREGAEA